MGVKSSSILLILGFKRHLLRAVDAPLLVPHELFEHDLFAGPGATIKRPLNLDPV